MEICVNTYSGKYFIFIQYVGVDRILLVTPIGEIKALEHKQFSEPIYKDEQLLLLYAKITRAQYEAYTTYKKNRDDEPGEKFRFMVENLTPWEQQQLYQYITAGENA